MLTYFFLQHNLRTKEMLGPTASVKKLEITQDHMKLFIDLRKSIRNLCIRRVDDFDGYPDGFVASVTLLEAYIWKKINNFICENPREVHYTKNFWYTLQINTKKWTEAPSAVCEAGSTQVYSYLEKNQKFVVECKEKLTVTDNSDAEEDDAGVETDEEDMYHVGLD